MDHAAALLEHNSLLGDTVAAAEEGLPVPSCPGWTVRDLVTHVGRGDRWAAEIVRTGAFLRHRDAPDATPPAEPREWLAASPRLLLDAVAADPAKEVWTFLGPRPAVWWVRRRLHEATVHLADAVLATGGHPRLAPAVAADGLSEYLDLVAARPPGESGGPLGPGATMHLHATDEGLGPGGEWTVREEAGAVRWEHGHAKGAVAVRGTASDLLLAVLRRLPADDDRLQVFGDAAVLTGWLERTGF